MVTKFINKFKSGFVYMVVAAAAMTVVLSPVVGFIHHSGCSHGHSACHHKYQDDLFATLNSDACKQKPDAGKFYRPHGTPKNKHNSSTCPVCKLQASLANGYVEIVELRICAVYLPETVLPVYEDILRPFVLNSNSFARAPPFL